MLSFQRWWIRRISIAASCRPPSEYYALLSNRNVCPDYCEYFRCFLLTFLGALTFMSSRRMVAFYYRLSYSASLSSWFTSLSSLCTWIIIRITSDLSFSFLVWKRKVGESSIPLNIIPILNLLRLFGLQMEKMTEIWRKEEIRSSTRSDIYSMFRI